MDARARLAAFEAHDEADVGDGYAEAGMPGRRLGLQRRAGHVENDRLTARQAQDCAARLRIELLNGHFRMQVITRLCRLEAPGDRVIDLQRVGTEGPSPLMRVVTGQPAISVMTAMDHDFLRSLLCAMQRCTRAP